MIFISWEGAVRDFTKGGWNDGRILWPDGFRYRCDGELRVKFAVCFCSGRFICAVVAEHVLRIWEHPVGNSTSLVNPTDQIWTMSVWYNIFVRISFQG